MSDGLSHLSVAGVLYARPRINVPASPVVPVTPLRRRRPPRQRKMIAHVQREWSAANTLHTEHAMTKPSEARVKTLRADLDEQAVELGSGRPEEPEIPVDKRYMRDHRKKFVDVDDWMRTDEW